ncbi:hypothetical protein DBIPINDM_003289 [Mesorhizobium sp. AR02]|nr:hypothetical protein DBIPINDM_003289 [Mesorhizobium sp. AR02]
MDRRVFLKSAALAGFSIATLPATLLRANADGSKVLRMAYGAEVLTLDPIKTTYGADILIQGMMYARLLHANPDRTEVGPGLAESWDIADDGKTYTFHLREAKFSDGSPITAEDVAFSWNRMRFQKDSAYAAPFQPPDQDRGKRCQDSGDDPRSQIHALPDADRNLEYRHRAEGSG